MTLTKMNVTKQKTVQMIQDNLNVKVKANAYQLQASVMDMMIVEMVVMKKTVKIAHAKMHLHVKINVNALIQN